MMKATLPAKERALPSRYGAAQQGVRLERRQRGVALVIVLAALVLLSGLMIAFFLSVSTERAGAKAFAQNNEARKLADTALNLVIAQIKDGTIGSGASTNVWISQPGLIRTFDTTGNPVSAYKLYSAANMRGGAAYDPTVDDQVPVDWASTPALYTDLNAPVNVVDPVTSSTTANYPILDASALLLPAADKIKGFDVSSSAPVAGQSNAVPMPVQWLYVLQNGEIVPAAAGGATPGSVTLSGTSASSSNPIVGRVAFWTDDETCKININTAAGDVWTDPVNATDPSYPYLGSYCDMPYTNGKAGTASKYLEDLLKTNQPMQHEYQRYPGHPATTYLSAVFPNILNDRHTIYDIVPRVSYFVTGDAAKKDISSQGGLAVTNQLTTIALSASDGDHLYSSMDELQFVVSSGSLAGVSRPANIFTPAQLQQAKFFLTAQSRAPDVNMFGKPRISMWPEIVASAGIPVTTGSLVGTAFDKTIAFCATIGSGATAKPYYFVRYDSSSPTYDYTQYLRNQGLYLYLQNLTSHPVPGYGASFSTKYGNDNNQILTEIFDYIRGCINLVDSTSTAPYAGSINKSSDARTLPAGTGQVVPIQIATATGTTQGFGRVYVPSTPFFHFVGLDTQIEDSYLHYAAAGSAGVLSGTAQRADKAKLFTNKVQVVLLFDNICPSLGVVRTVPNLIYEVNGLQSFQLNGQSLNFHASCSTNFCAYTPNHEYAWGGTASPGCLFYKHTYDIWSPKVLSTGSNEYQFYSDVISFPRNTVEFRQPLYFSGGDVTMNIYAVDKAGNKNRIKTVALSYPPTWIPTPGAEGCYSENYDAPYPKQTPRLHCYPNYPSNPSAPDKTYLVQGTYGYNVDAPGPTFQTYRCDNWVVEFLFDVTRGLVPSHGDIRLVAASANIDKSVFVPARGYIKSQGDIETAFNPAGALHRTYAYHVTAQRLPPLPPIIGPEDNSGGSAGGGAPRASNFCGNFSSSGVLVPEATYDIYQTKDGGVGPTYLNRGPAVPSIIDGTPGHAATLTGLNGSQCPGDWDTGMTDKPDGPYINKADEGDFGAGAYGSLTEYISNPTLFSPNRQVPSPVIFGSLSTGVAAGKPWQTLLFCPNPAAKDQHPGSANPPDHLLLDLFHMPVVEPYAISEPFSTAGKINLNYQIAPFTYITRNTGLQAVLRSTRVIAIPTTEGLNYKATVNKTTSQYRLSLDIDESLKGFESRFALNKPFRSASEICEMFLVPKGLGKVYADMADWWDGYKLTGDNLREKPYAQIYSRLTTKSNSYTVHVRVQALKKIGSDPNQNQWNEQTDRVAGEYRGSFGVERFIDPNDPALATFDENNFGNVVYNSDGTVQASGQLDPYYKFRIVSTKKFAP